MFVGVEQIEKYLIDEARTAPTRYMEVRESNRMDFQLAGSERERERLLKEKGGFRV